jgi:pyruvate,water dikinase
VRPGDVLVCRTTEPTWTPLLGVVAAVVTEIGGVLSHAAIVARELGIPAVLGVAEATRQLPSGCPIEVDGSSGLVTEVREP